MSETKIVDSTSSVNNAPCALDKDLALELIGQLIHPAESIEAVSQTRERLLNKTETARILDDFLRQNPNPAVWFCEQFPYIKPEQVKACIRPLGVSFHLEGYAYGEFILNEKIRSLPKLPISYGVTLTLGKLPAQLDSLFVVVNEGDGKVGRRSGDQIMVTEVHEELHQLFNLFFRNAPFISSRELSSRLKSVSLDAMKEHRSLACDLAAGMLEISRSEIISYFGTGEYDVGKRQLCSNFWFSHFKAVRSYCNEQQASMPQRDAILRCYHESFLNYRQALYRIKEYAVKTCQQSPELDETGKVAAMLYFAPAIPTAFVCNDGNLNLKAA